MRALISALHMYALAAMSADFDTESVHIEPRCMNEMIAISTVRSFFCIGTSPRISLWHRDFVTSLVQVGYDNPDKSGVATVSEF